MEKLAQAIVNQIKNDNPEISESQLSIMKFGLECVISEVSKLAAYFIVFWLLSLTEYYVVSALAYCIVRSASGGYHEETYLRCMITSFAIFVVIISLSRTLPLDFMPGILIVAASLISAWIFAPVDHPNKPILSGARRKKLKYVTCALIILTGALSYFVEPWIATTMVYSVGMAGLMLPIGLFANKFREKRNIGQGSSE